MDLNIGIGGLL